MSKNNSKGKKPIVTEKSIVAAPLFPQPFKARPKPKQPLQVADVAIDHLMPIQEADVEVPALEEARVYRLQAALDRTLRCTNVPERPHRFSVMDEAARPTGRSRGRLSVDLGTKASTPKSGRPLSSSSSASRGGSPQSKGLTTPRRAQSPHGTSPRTRGGGKAPPDVYSHAERCMVTAAAFYKALHGTTLRVHEEISRNTGINVAELALMETKLSAAYTALAMRRREADDAALDSPVSPKALHRGPGSLSAATMRAAMSPERERDLLGGGPAGADPSGGAPRAAMLPAEAPPIVLLCFLLFCASGDDVDSLFPRDADDGPVNAPSRSSHRARGTDPKLVGLRAQLLAAVKAAERQKQMLQEQRLLPTDASAALGTSTMSASAAPVAFSHTKTLDELRLALHPAEGAEAGAEPGIITVINKWCGTLAILIAALAQATRNPEPHGKLSRTDSSISSRGSATPKEAPVVGRRPRSLSLSLSSPPQLMRRLSQTVLSATLPDVLAPPPPEQRLQLRYRVTCASTPAALEALKALSLQCLRNQFSLPLLFSVTGSDTLIPRDAAVPLRAAFGVEPSAVMEDPEATEQDRLAAHFEGWHVSLQPPPPPDPPKDREGKGAQGGAGAAGKDANKKKGRAKAPKVVPMTPEEEQAYLAGLPTSVVVELHVRPHHALSLRWFSTHGGEDEFLLAPTLRFRLKAVDVPNLRLELLAEDPQHPPAPEVTQTPSPEASTTKATAQQRRLSAQAGASTSLPKRRDTAAASPTKGGRSESPSQVSPPTQPAPAAAPVPEALEVLPPIFLPTVLDDAGRASVAAGRMVHRLVEEFIQPHHCHRHPTQRYQHFCLTCRTCICGACARELHAAHSKHFIKLFAASEVRRMQPKVALLQERVGCLKAAIAQLDPKAQALHALIDTAIDSVRTRLEDRRARLHADAEERAEGLLSQLQHERGRCADEAQAIAGAAEVIRMGVVSNAIPKPLVPEKYFQITDALALQVPSSDVSKLVRLLTWSNPSKYLTSVLYPPAASGGAGTGNTANNAGPSPRATGAGA